MGDEWAKVSNRRWVKKSTLDTAWLELCQCIDVALFHSDLTSDDIAAETNLPSSWITAIYFNLKAVYTNPGNDMRTTMLSVGRELYNPEYYR